MNERIKKLREMLGKSQEDFSKEIGLSRNYISLVENGQRFLSEQSIKVLCSTYNVSREWLETGAGEPILKKEIDEQIAEMLADIQLSGNESFKHRLIAALSNLSEQDWKSLEKLIDMISSKN